MFKQRELRTVLPVGPGCRGIDSCFHLEFRVVQSKTRNSGTLAINSKSNSYVPKLLLNSQILSPKPFASLCCGLCLLFKLLPHSL